MRLLDGLPDFPFSIEARDGEARAGSLETPRGVVYTPCFMPVGTKGTVKAVAPDRLQKIGARIILANTYHLALRPGSDLVRLLGGLHRFMNWDGPILTDSGGYQVFSLRDTARVDDTGVAFRSVYDGSKHVFTPERAMAEQQALGADLIMCLDECPPATAGEFAVKEAVERTAQWAARCKLAHQEKDGQGTDGPQMLLGIVQGGILAHLRRESAERLVALDLPGYAIGGLSVGEDRQAMLETTALTASLLPGDRLRYYMGLGDPSGLVHAIAQGVDLFDCVLPTRTARMGSALTPSGRLNLRNAEHALSPEPIQAGCPCTACAGFSRGYLRHLVMQKEILGMILLTEHNLTFLTRLVAGAREAIVAGRLASFADSLAVAW